LLRPEWWLAEELGLKLAPQNSVIGFFGVVFVPLGDLYDDIGGTVGHGLAAEPRFLRNAWSHVEFVEFGVSGVVAGFEALLDDDVAGGSGAHAAASVVQPGFDAFGDIENAAGEAVVAVGNFRRVDLDGFAAGKKCDFEFLRGGRVFDFFDVRIASAHFSFTPLRLPTIRILPNRGTMCPTNVRPRPGSCLAARL
jgi:hypothetical protein